MGQEGNQAFKELAEAFAIAQTHLKAGLKLKNLHSSCPGIPVLPADRALQLSGVKKREATEGAAEEKHFKALLYLRNTYHIRLVRDLKVKSSSV